MDSMESMEQIAWVSLFIGNNPPSLGQIKLNAIGDPNVDDLRVAIKGYFQRALDGYGAGDLLLKTHDGVEPKLSALLKKLPPTSEDEPFKIYAIDSKGNAFYR